MIELEFNKRPIDIPADLRLYRRLAMLCISIHKCSKDNSASFKQLHFFNTLLLNKKFLENYRRIKNKKSNSNLNILSPSIDPYLNRCVNYAIGANLVEQIRTRKNYKIHLTLSGQSFVQYLEEEEIMNNIFTLCDELGKILEQSITKLGKSN